MLFLTMIFFIYKWINPTGAQALTNIINQHFKSTTQELISTPEGQTNANQTPSRFAQRENSLWAEENNKNSSETFSRFAQRENSNQQLENEIQSRTSTVINEAFPPIIVDSNTSLKTSDHTTPITNQESTTKEEDTTTRDYNLINWITNHSQTGESRDPIIEGTSDETIYLEEEEDNEIIYIPSNPQPAAQIPTSSSHKNTTPWAKLTPNDVKEAETIFSL